MVMCTTIGSTYNINHDTFDYKEKLLNVTFTNKTCQYHKCQQTSYYSLTSNH